jgi:hypothetical protein
LLVLAATLFAITSPSMARPLALAIMRRLRQRGAHQPSIRLNNDYLVGASALTGVNSRS